MDVFRRLKGRPWRHRHTRLIDLFSSLRFRLLALVLFAACPALVLALYTDAAWRRHDIQDTHKYALVLVQLLAAEKEQVVRGAHDLLVSIGQVPAVLRGDPDRCPEILAGLRRSFPYYANFGAIRPDGRLSCSAVPVQGPIDFGDRPFFRRVMESRSFVAGDYGIDSTTGKFTVRFAAPLLDPAERVQAVVFAELELGWYGKRLAGVDVPPGTSITLVDRNGVILAREPEGEQWVGRVAATASIVRTIVGEPREGTGVMEDLDGVQKLVAFAPVLGLPTGISGHLAVGIPLEVAFADTDRAFAQNVWALGAAGIAIVLLTWVSADALLLRRVKAMIGMAQRLRAGDVSARSGVAQGSGELSQLAAAFDSMAIELEKRQAEARCAEEALRAANDDLERAVRERTAHLVVANEAQQVILRDLKRTQDHLAEQQAQLSGIIETAMEAIITIGEDDLIMVFNREAERIFRLPAAEAIGRTVDRFIPERFRVAHTEGLRFFDREGAVGVGKRIGSVGSAFAMRADGEEFPFEAAVSQVKIRGETLHTIILRDISALLRTEDMLRKLSQAVERTTESVFITNRDGIIEYVNPAFEKVTGYRREEAIGRTPRILKSGEHNAAFYGKLWKTILSGEVQSVVFLNRKKTGDTYYEDQTIAPIRDDGKNITHFVAIGRDVTDRDRAEKEVRKSREQLRALAAHLESIREEEQKRIAREIHDGLGHMLTAMKYDLAWLEPQVAEASTSLRDRVRELTSLTDATIATVRRIASDLRPRLLDDLGLEAAVEWLTKTFQSRTKIQCELDSRLGDVVLDPGLSTAVFRILQECLTNVARHAHATSVTVDLYRDDEGGLVLGVRDDGKGISQNEIAGMQSLGLVGMRERAHGCGGEITISTTAGAGTTVVARFPVVFKLGPGDAPSKRLLTHNAAAGEDTT